MLLHEGKRGPPPLPGALATRFPQSAKESSDIKEKRKKDDLW
jgi:hypothetical protein